MPRPAAGCPHGRGIGSSFVLVLAAWLFVLLAQGSELVAFPLLIAIGMTLGFAGDLFMAGLIPSRSTFSVGMRHSALGHVAYIAAGLRLGGRSGPAARRRHRSPRGCSGCSSPPAPGISSCSAASEADSAALGCPPLLAPPRVHRRGRHRPGAPGRPPRSPRPRRGPLPVQRPHDRRQAVRGQVRPGRIDDLIWLTYGPGQCLIVYTTASPASLLPRLISLATIPRQSFRSYESWSQF